MTILCVPVTAFQMMDKEQGGTSSVIRKKFGFSDTAIGGDDLDGSQMENSPTRLEKTLFYEDENRWLRMHSCPN